MTPTTTDEKLASRDKFVEFDRTRDFSTKAFASLCYAPFTILYFTNQGNVQVCCHNWKHPVGNILNETLDEIWHGERIRALRNALSKYTFGPGCEFCEFQTADGCFGNAAMRTFDQFAVSSQDPEWPQQFEFSISNVCNLECIMCRGQWSSAIRSRREKLPPLPRLYSDAILESFRKYLHHLKRMKFLGGEPFLIEEHYKIWNMMSEESLSIPCHVTTNGTQYNDRIERVLEKVPMSFAISLDAVSKETYESIRVNGKYESVMENVRRFREYTRGKGTGFGLTFCLMRQNWHEFGDYCAFAETLDCTVCVNLVRKPPEFGVYTLPQDDLRKIVDALEKQSVKIAPRLVRNREVWFGELERLRRRCETYLPVPD